MIELFTLPKKFAGMPSNINSGDCSLLFHRIDESTEIVHVWHQCRFRFTDKMQIISESIPKLPPGIYQIPIIHLIQGGNNDPFLSATNPADFTLPEVIISDRSFATATSEQVAHVTQGWEKSVAIGKPEDVKEIKYAEAHFICSDCLITRPYRIGPAELYPLPRSDVYDLTASIKGMLQIQGIRNVQLHEVRKHLSEAEDRRSPLFCMSFRRIYRDDSEYIEPLMPYIKRVFGILSLNRGSYSRLLGGVYLKQFDDRKSVYYMNLNSYYRGNLIGGSISGERITVLNQQYEHLKDSPFNTEIVSKLNSATAEIDLDLAYFRFWSILETVSNKTQNDKDLKSIKIMIERAYDVETIENEIKLVFGNESFNYNELVAMWLDWRDMTSHNGGIYSYYSDLRKMHGRNIDMINEMKRLNRPVEFGEDRSLMLLKDVTTKVVRAYVEGNL